MMNYFWFRRDLRLHDNHGLHAALQNSQVVRPIFIFDTDILDKLTSTSDPRLCFIHNKLSELDEQIKALGGSGLFVYYGKVDQVWQTLLKQSPGNIYCNRDYEPRAIDRDLRVEELLRTMGKNFNSFKDQVIFEEDDILKADGTPYTVYTPYRKAWEKHFSEDLLTNFPSESHRNFDTQECPPIPSLAQLGFETSEASQGAQNLDTSLLKDYKTNRDFPALDASSRLSVQLRFGTISIRELVKQSLAHEVTYLHELIWREFFMMIIYHFPDSANNEFKEKYSAVPWKHDEENFKKWCFGKTGYPMVDAGMRELNATGYMHNRVRMVTASFLVKHLLIDWRWGEQYFARKLMDYDLSANVGNWQWAAGCGCDAAPYFRVFNPTAQQERFDKDEEYIKKWIPEYNTMLYPEPMIEHKFARERAIETYKKALN
ncbi:deoxyribodipyrimidine photo-lyase [Lentisphaera marina]|uniref:cryptochrome/photolyase family protein n=1 Tax=Lentisphaera marina TaxID=1111041 RepID=UPI00236573C9|nr:deoxyribodipyrimidine photo-lyase [Lentisphaera marina]MDD7984861.1 deoxyribodipyrimidine photo-lyase [Lentisphaera marina]